MSDIVQRLRKWCHAVNAASAQDLMDEAADEIERLQEIVAGYTAGISAGNEAKQSYGRNDEKRSDANTISLTDAERQAIELIATLDAYRYPTLPAAAATLRNLLERMK